MFHCHTSALVDMPSYCYRSDFYIHQPLLDFTFTLKWNPGCLWEAISFNMISFSSSDNPQSAGIVCNDSDRGVQCRCVPLSPSLITLTEAKVINLEIVTTASLILLWVWMVIVETHEYIRNEQLLSKRFYKWLQSLLKYSLLAYA